MRTTFRVIRLSDLCAQARQALHLDLDYELASLADAMAHNNEAEKVRCKKALKLIVEQLDLLKD